ncbi:purine-cytosine permease family protein [Mycobacterium sp. SMC-4]|uniref:purine-cytosine permease family protein n=1 Tax=Mycobacterium sp. SMC-4 TaxID=2857059 RepID=UPI003CFF4A10
MSQLIEQRSIDQIPANERYGSVRHQFTLWFANNMQVSNVAYGAVPIFLGLPVHWAIMSIVVGHVIGGALMALHSAQGPKLGIPQMIQSRAQFGYVGATLPMVVVFIMFAGFNAACLVLTGYMLSSLLGVSVDVGIVLGTVGIILLPIFGYKILHVCQKWVSLIAGIAFVVMTFNLLRNYGFGDTSAGEFSWGMFVLSVAIMVTFQLCYAPYVADYSRYLPEETSVKKTFWFTFAGTVTACVWTFSFGAIAAAAATDAFAGGNPDFIVAQAGFAIPLFLLIMIISNTAAPGLGVYACFMSAITVVTTFVKVRITFPVKAAGMTLIGLTAMLLAVLGRENFLGNVTAFIAILGYFMVPWTAINLVDFYLVRKERYSIPDIFDPVGRYAGIDWRAMSAYLIAIVVSVPFMSTEMYVGPFVEPLGGMDIAWLVSLVLAAALYLWNMSRYPARRGFIARLGDEPVRKDGDDSGVEKVAVTP